MSKLATTVCHCDATYTTKNRIRHNNSVRHLANFNHGWLAQRVGAMALVAASVPSLPALPARGESTVPAAAKRQLSKPSTPTIAQCSIENEHSDRGHATPVVGCPTCYPATVAKSWVEMALSFVDTLGQVTAADMIGYGAKPGTAGTLLGDLARAGRLSRRSRGVYGAPQQAQA